MDKKELREFMGQPHFAPKMNLPKDKRVLSTPKIDLSKMIQRRHSMDSDTSSPVGSPTSPMFTSSPPQGPFSMPHTVKSNNKMLFKEFDFK
ncbi:hypothetical protein CHS0354_021131 [Potamilus streckersoni]|uniref:Uncharacterized protein n=1 Tax=Potamilus streckersoni TaxID=2493646 RepID=A0AAE0W4R9_9BIVA|nr:hypothetical protein CHS0354_021131 [Potamilus streckersoni]